MKVKDGLTLANAIVQMGDLVYGDHLDTALAIIENQEKLSKFFERNQEALKKLTKLSTSEETFIKKFPKYAKLSEDEKSNLSEEESVVLASVLKKNKLVEDKNAELNEKELKLALIKIDRDKLPSGLKIWQLAALKCIFKEESK